MLEKACGLMRVWGLAREEVEMDEAVNYFNSLVASAMKKRCYCDWCDKVVAMRCIVDGKVKLLCADCYSKL